MRTLYHSIDDDFLAELLIDNDSDDEVKRFKLDLRCAMVTV